MTELLLRLIVIIWRKVTRRHRRCLRNIRRLEIACGMSLIEKVEWLADGLLSLEPGARWLVEDATLVQVMHDPYEMRAFLDASSPCP